MSTESQKLLAAYAETGSEAAFRELVERYSRLVHATARRMTGGRLELAQEIAQAVFADLAAQAQRLSGTALLGGWLHRHTVLVARTVLRGERRRTARERRAVEWAAADRAEPDRGATALAPDLDEALNGLTDRDRTAILLRFFEGLDYQRVGAALGATEEAARKRVDRALGKLQAALKKRGSALSGAALAAVLPMQGAAASQSTGMMQALLVAFMNSIKSKAALAAAAALACLAPAGLQHQLLSRARTENETLRGHLARLQTENRTLESRAARVDSDAALARENWSELLRLRNEAGSLRAEQQRLAGALAEAVKRRSEPAPAAGQEGDASAPPRKMATIAVNNMAALAAEIRRQNPGLEAAADDAVLRGFLTAGGAEAEATKIVIDPRTNRLLVAGNPEAVARAEESVAHLEAVLVLTQEPASAE